MWWDPLARQSTVEQWLPIAQGNPMCADRLIGFVASLGNEDQARVGLPRGWRVLFSLAPADSRTALSCCRRG
jgi:hypothetical protein